jgi:L-aspartate oxidase
MEVALLKLRELATVCEERLSVTKGYTMQLAEVMNLLDAGELMLRCALMRKESRGLHYTLDYPEAVDDEKKPTFIADGATRPSLTRRPAPAPR